VPTVTSSRVVPPLVPNSQYWIFGTPQSTEVSIGWPGLSQTTTSYRSRKRDEDMGGDYSRMTGPEIIRNLRKDYQTRFDNGHEFFTQKTSSVVSHPQVDIFSSPFSPRPGLHYQGPLWPMKYNIDLEPPDIIPDTPEHIAAMGRQAISSTIPTAPEAGVAAFVGELRERLPDLIGYHAYRNGLTPSSAGHEVLNYEFGLAPIPGDIKKMALSVLHSHKLLSQLRRGSGQNIRRRRIFDPTETVVSLGTDTSILSLPRMNGTGIVAQDFYTSVPGKKVFDRSWSQTTFAGAYTYHLDETDNFLGRMESYLQQANYLLGTEITPDVVWQLTPWSWLIDWFSDFGTFIKNVSLLSSDSLVLRYAYLMVHNMNTRSHYVTDMVPMDNRNPSAVSLDVIKETKSRYRATPYGFGLDVSAFSPRKWAILAALGLTKSDKSLRYIG